jgi:predicted AAA+ superfamily ATPase
MSGASRTIPRLLAPRLLAALRDSPAVLLHGPRQSGKTTLARTVGEARGYRYVSFDKDAVLTAAKADPAGFVAQLPVRSILDEVQRIPGIFTSLKAEIDRRRTAGRFILTGSANVLLVPRLADSLPGRMEILRLHPLAQSEIAGTRPNFIDHLFRGQFKTSLHERLGGELAQRVVSGGYPAALARRAAARRRAWYRDYAAYTARLINVADLAAPFELTRPTVHEHITLLERVFLLERLPSWHNSHMSRLVKRSKLHIGDTGVACALLGLDAARLDADRSTFGPMLETFVLQELKRQASGRPDPLAFHHFRDRDDFEVDIVLEEGGARLAGVEVKAAASVNESDLRGLRKLSAAAGKRFVAGVVLYDGEATIVFGDGLFAVPVRTLWE